jgi:3-oxoacyl-[acyl-carrier protein] reductase
MKKIKSILFLIIGIYIAPPIYAKTFLITCATSGFGQAIASALAEQNHDLILLGRDVQKLQELKDILEALYKGNYRIYGIDFKNANSFSVFKDTIKSTSLDGIVVIPPRYKCSQDVIPATEEWQDFFNMGFLMPLEVLKASLSSLKNPSAIVIIAGITSVYYIPEYANSNILRLMWLGELKNLTFKLGPLGIRVNMISPNIILTTSHNKRIQLKADQEGISFKDQLEKESAEIPLHKFGTAEDVAEAVSFLISERAGHITGVNLLLDGGLSRAY